jgi:hypothetical protein
MTGSNSSNEGHAEPTLDASMPSPPPRTGTPVAPGKPYETEAASRERPRHRRMQRTKPDTKDALRAQHEVTPANLGLAATLFPLDGLDGVAFAFRVLRVREAMPDDSLRTRRLQRMADQLWQKELKCAVYPTTRFDFPGFLMPADRTLPPGWRARLHDVPDQHYTIEATNLQHVVAVAEARDAERELVCRMIERSLTDRLLQQRNQVWRGEHWTVFFARQADNEDLPTDVVRAFRGIKFGVVLLGGCPYLAADVRTKYLGRTSLADLLARGERDLLRAHVTERVKPHERALFVRDNGTKKMACRYVGDAQTTIGQHTFTLHGQSMTVFEYYRIRYPDVPVSPSDRTVFVEDKKGGLTLPVPASRLFPVFTTDFDAIRRCSVAPTLAPADRVSVLQRFLPLLDGARYGDRELVVRRSPWRGPRTIVPPPTLEFGNGVLVRAFASADMPSVREPQFDRAISRFGMTKLAAVDAQRPYHNEPIPNATLFFPETLVREHRERFLFVLTAEIEKLTGQRLRVAEQVPYQIGAGQREGASLMRQVERRTGEPAAGVAIVILSQTFRPSVHGALKEAFDAGHSQCVTEAKARELATGAEPSRIAGLVRNLALALLTEVGVMPWVLAEPLHHDIHLGIDLLHGRIGYHAFFGLGGRHIWTESGTTLHQGHMREQIKRPELRRRVEQVVRHVAAAREPCGSLVIHRDGRWWPTERDGLRDAVANLVADGVVPATFRVAVAEVRKNHMPVRLFTHSAMQSPATSGPDGPGTVGLANPLPGSYLILDAQRALLATTGRPGSWDSGRRGRTATTLLIDLVDIHGTLSLLHVVEDLYWLTHLNWSAPDIEIALPVTIRWTDRALRETLRREPMSAHRHTASAEGVA